MRIELVDNNDTVVRVETDKKELKIVGTICKHIQPLLKEIFKKNDLILEVKEDDCSRKLRKNKKN